MMRAAVGTVFESSERMGNLTRHRFKWISDAAGDVTYRIDRMDGVAVSLEWKDQNAGGNSYTVTLVDDLGKDWSLGLITSTSTGGSGRAPLVEEVISSIQARPAPLPSPLHLIVDCSTSAVYEGIIDIWVQNA